MSLIDKSLTNPVVVNFNSKDRVSGSNSNFNSAPIDLGNNAFDTVCLIQASIPKSFYNVPSGYNTFVLRESDGFTTTNTTITIPPGSYTRINLQSVLSTILTNASPDGLTYTITYPASTAADTFHYTFNVDVGSAYDISFILTDRSPYRQLGLEIGTYTFIDTSLTNSALESVNAINLSYILRAFIKSNLVADATDSILEELLNFGSFPSNSVMSYQQVNFDMNSRAFNPNNKNSWNFVLQDAFGQEIDLNGISWAFSVVFYQRNKIHEIHKTELQMSNEERLFRIEQEQQKLNSQINETDLATPSEQTTQSGLLTTTVPLGEPSLSTIQPLYPVTSFGNTTLFLPK
jgi:hypothetical protein